MFGFSTIGAAGLLVAISVIFIVGAVGRDILRHNQTNQANQWIAVNDPKLMSMQVMGHSIGMQVHAPSPLDVTLAQQTIASRLKDEESSDYAITALVHTYDFVGGNLYRWCAWRISKDANAEDLSTTELRNVVGILAHKEFNLDNTFVIEQLSVVPGVYKHSNPLAA